MPGMHPVILATPGPSTLCMQWEYGGKQSPKREPLTQKGFMKETIFLAFRICAYSGDLNVVQLLLPVENALHPVHPHVDVSNQHRLANPLN